MVSIIIPCFNSGDFLLEAVESCFRSYFKEIEILIVNDGSTDDLTISHLEGFEKSKKVSVLHQTNQGVANARNYGVKHAKGHFLFFLDADNRIRPEYIGEAVAVMNTRPEVAVVYGKPYFFNETGEAPKRFTARPYSLDSLLVGNYIDMCALVRREAFDQVNGFDESRNLHGWEDWDLWVRIGLKKWGFYFLDKVLYEYRVEENSMMGKMTQDLYSEKLAYFTAKHSQVIFSRMKHYYPAVLGLRTRPFRFFVSFLVKKFILRKKTI